MNIWTELQTPSSALVQCSVWLRFFCPLKAKFFYSKTLRRFSSPSARRRLAPGQKHSFCPLKAKNVRLAHFLRLKPSRSKSPSSSSCFIQILNFRNFSLNKSRNYHLSNSHAASDYKISL